MNDEGMAPAGLARLSVCLGLSVEETAALLPGPVWALPDQSSLAADTGFDDQIDWGTVPTVGRPDLAWLAAGDDLLVLVGVTADAVTVALPRIEWMSQTPMVVAASRETAALDVAPEELRAWFVERVAATLRHRKASFRRCGRCGKLTAPEHRLGTVCHRCAEADGVVF